MRLNTSSMFNAEFHCVLHREEIFASGILSVDLRWTRLCNCLFFRLTSPSGTQSVLLFERPRDVLDSSFEDWPFMSVHFWGERAAGRWKLEIINAGNKRVNKPGILKKWQLVFYGTDTNPIRLRSPAKPTSASVAVTAGRDVSGLVAPPSIATPQAATFSNIGRNPSQQDQLFLSGQSGFRPSFFPNTNFPDFLQFAGSEQVTYAASPDDATSPSTINKSDCPKYSLYG